MTAPESLLARIFPASFDNTYRGHPLGLWLMFPLTFAALLMGAVVILSGDSKAQSADGIPLDTFTHGGAQAVIGAVALLGLAKLLMGLLQTITLFRYRAMIPLMYGLIVSDLFAHRAIMLLKPIPHVGAPGGGFVVMVLTALSVLGLVCAVIGKGYAKREGAL